GPEPVDEWSHVPARGPAVVRWRAEVEQQVLRACSQELRVAVIRPGFVYGEGAGVLAGLFAAVARTGKSGIPGDGENHWSVVHCGDLAHLYALVIEAQGTGLFHGVDSNPLPLKELLAGVGKTTS